MTSDRISLLLASTAADQAAWLAGLQVKYGLRCHGQPSATDLGWPEPVWNGAYELLTVTPAVVSLDGEHWWVMPAGMELGGFLGWQRSGEPVEDLNETGAQ